MEMLYTSRGIYNFIDVNMGERRAVESTGLMYKVRMLEKNQISCLISPYENEIDGRFYLRYNTESNYVMDRLLQKIKPDGEFLRVIISQLLQCINDSVSYLLDPNDIVINPAYMFFDYNEKKLRLICVPGYEKDITGQLRDFLEYIMRIFDHRDSSGVKYLYELYEEVTEDNFSMYEYGRLQKDRLVMLSEGCIKEQELKMVQIPHLPVDKAVKEINREVAEKPEKEDFDRLGIDREKADKDELDKGYIWVTIIFAVSLVIGVKYVLGGRNPVWLIFCIGGFLISTIAMMSVLSRTRDEREIDESMTDYAASIKKADGQEKNNENHEEQSRKNASVSVQTAGSENEGVKRKLSRLVPLNNGCLAPLNIDGEKCEFSIGRGKRENDYRLSGSQISRVHARVYRRNVDVYLKDAGSTNGTFVNSVRLGENEEIKLNRGDVVAFATEEFFVS